MKTIILLSLLSLSNLAFAQGGGILPNEVVQQCEELGLFLPNSIFKNVDIDGCNKKGDGLIECTDGQYKKTQDFMDKVVGFFKSEKKEKEKQEKRKDQCLKLGFAKVDKLVNCSKVNSDEIHCPDGAYKNSKDVAEVERDNIKETEPEKEIGKDAKKASKQ